MNPALAEVTFGRFAREQLALRLSRVEEQWLRCSETASASDIHDVRVAMRRFGEPLRVFKKIFPKQARKQVSTELRQVMKLAGRTRDVDIVRNCFLHADIVLSRELSLFLLNERAAAEAGLRAAVSVGLATQFAARWQQSLVLAERPAAALHEDRVASLARDPKSLWHEHALISFNARSVLPNLLDKYCGQGDYLRGRKIAKKRLHELRLNGKHLRYVLELFRPVYGRRMDELLSVLKEAQSQLGDITDAAATLAWMSRHELEQTPEGQQLRLFLDLRADKLSAKFTDFWNERWGLPVFRNRWAGYLRRYAGQMPPRRASLAQHPDERAVEAS